MEVKEKEIEQKRKVMRRFRRHIKGKSVKNKMFFQRPYMEGTLRWIGNCRNYNLIQGELEHLHAKKVLDFGCGGGWLTITLLNSKPSLEEIVGVDISSNCCHIARKRSNTHMLSARGVFLVADGEYLPFRNCTFDASICVAALYQLPNIERGIQELIRVTNQAVMLVDEPLQLRGLIRFLYQFFTSYPKKVDKTSTVRFNIEKIKLMYHVVRVRPLWSLQYLQYLRHREKALFVRIFFYHILKLLHFLPFGHSSFIMIQGSERRRENFC